MAESSIGEPAKRAERGGRVPPVLRRLESRWSVENANVVAVAAVVLTALGQLAEDLADTEPLQLLEPAAAVRRWTVIAAVLYLVAISRFVDVFIERSLDDLKAVMDIDARKFGRYARRLGPLRLLIDATVLGGAALVVVGLFVGLGSELPIDDPVTGLPMPLPGTALGRVAVLAGYTIVGWAAVSLVVSTIRRAIALGRLSREELKVDVFDTTNLLPFGNIALATALAPAGLIVILLIGFGRPSAPVSWSILLLATAASLVALILPLRGVHRQMERTKEQVLAGLNAKLRAIYERDLGSAETSDTEAAHLNNRASTLTALRKVVGEMTTWPFQDTLAFGRAVLIAMAPLIYTIASELIKVWFINPLIT